MELESSRETKKDNYVLEEKKKKRLHQDCCHLAVYLYHRGPAADREELRNNKLLLSVLNTS